MKKINETKSPQLMYRFHAIPEASAAHLEETDPLILEFLQRFKYSEGPSQSSQETKLEDSNFPIFNLLQNSSHEDQNPLNYTLFLKGEFYGV